MGPYAYILPPETAQIHCGATGLPFFRKPYVEILERVCAVGVYSTAARELGLDDVSYQRGGIELFDGVPFNAEDPIGYLNQLSIHQDFSVAEIPIGVPRALAS